MKEVKVAIISTAGLIGQELIKVMEQRSFPLSELRFFSSDHSAGKKLFIGHRQIEVKEAEHDSFKGIDIVLLSTGADTSRYFSPIAVRSGAVVIDSSPVFRMLPTVPLVVPDVNAEDIKGHRGIISNPGGITAIMVTVLNPLHKINTIKRVIVSTFQAVSDLGSAAVEELTTQTKQVLEGHSTAPHIFPHQVAFNVVPETDVFLDNGYSREEWNLVEESRKIMHYEDLMVSATSVRVPVLVGHSAAVHIEFSKSITVEDARSALTMAAGIRVIDDTTISLYPQPWSVAGTDDVCVGRIRRDETHPNGLVMWVAADNVRKGIALNAVRVAEEMIKRDWLKPARG